MEDTKARQVDMVLQHLHDFGSITQKDATEYYGIMRLPARINDLRNFGFEITTVNETCKNRFGKTVKYARYYFGKGKK